MGPLFLGIVLDSYGPRVCSLVSILVIASGFFIFSLPSTSELQLFMPGMCLIAFGGPGAQSAIIHLSNLFPELKATMTAIITGCFQLSFIIFYIFDECWINFGWTYSQLFRAYCIVCLLNLTITYCIWPDQPLNYDEQMRFLHPNDIEEVHEVSKTLRTTYRLPSVMLSPTRSILDRTTINNGDYGGIQSARDAQRVAHREEVAAFFAAHDLPDNNENSIRRKHLPKALELVSFGIAQELANLTNTETC
jgi:MFS family permease